MQKFMKKYISKIAGVCLILTGLLGFFGAENQVLRILGVLFWGVALLALGAGVVMNRREKKRERKP